MDHPLCIRENLRHIPVESHRAGHAILLLPLPVAAVTVLGGLRRERHCASLCQLGDESDGGNEGLCRSSTRAICYPCF